MSYEKQAIIAILTGEGRADGVIRNASQNLAVKWFESHHGSFDNCHNVYLRVQNIVEVRLGRYKANWDDEEMLRMREILPRVDDTWRLYIVGHGNWKAASCGGVCGPEMAKLLLDGGLTSVKLISLVACRGAFKSSPPTSALPGNDRRLRRIGPQGTYWYPPSGTGFLHCFAGDFHYHLGKGFKFPVGHARRLRRVGRQGTYWYPPSEQGKDPPSEQVKVRTTVYARVGVTNILNEEAATSRFVVRNPGVTNLIGRKMTTPNELAMEELNLRPDVDIEALQAALSAKLVHKRRGSKIAYTWEGDKQVRKVVNYDTAALFRLDLEAWLADDDEDAD